MSFKDLVAAQDCGTANPLANLASQTNSMGGMLAETGGFQQHPGQMAPLQPGLSLSLSPWASPSLSDGF